jgi:hypothetical protein
LGRLYVWDAVAGTVCAMPYPGQFVRLVIIGGLYGDTYNTSLSIVPSALGELGMPAVDAPTLAAVAADVAAWYVGTVAPAGPRIIQRASLRSIKLNRIGADGKYVDPVTMEHIYPAPIAGGSTGIDVAPQLTMAATLRTAIPRGRGSRGRMYLPPTQYGAVVSTDGRVAVASAQGQAGSVVDLINRLNTTYTLIGRVGVASNAGAGRFEHVTQVSCGRVVDTMRSRRSTLDEDYQDVTVP